MDKEARKAFEAQVDMNGAELNEKLGIYYKDKQIDKELMGKWMLFYEGWTKGRNSAMCDAAIAREDAK